MYKSDDSANKTFFFFFIYKINNTCESLDIENIINALGFFLSKSFERWDGSIYRFFCSVRMRRELSFILFSFV